MSLIICKPYSQLDKQSQEADVRITKELLKRGVGRLKDHIGRDRARVAVRHFLKPSSEFASAMVELASTTIEPSCYHKTLNLSVQMKSIHGEYKYLIEEQHTCFRRSSQPTLPAACGVHPAPNAIASQHLQAPPVTTLIELPSSKSLPAASAQIPRNDRKLERPSAAKQIHADSPPSLFPLEWC